jgi:hypothetical protein
LSGLAPLNLVTAAVFGLVGVVIGGLISGRATYLMARRQERAALRQAKRLVADELFDIALQLSILREDGATPPESSPMRHNPLPSTSWEMNKATLAQGLSDKDWDDLPGFYSRMEAYRTSLIASGGEQAIGERTDRDPACGDGPGDSALRQALRNPFCTQRGA